VNDLERRLQTLGAEVEFPPEPDLTGAVLARLERRPFPWRRVGVVALAVLALAVATAFAVPQARSTILRWFHLRGATVELVQTLPPADERSQAGGLGRPLERDRAERLLGFRLALPPLDGPPRRVYVLDGVLATVVLHAYGRPILLSEYRAGGYDLLKKLAYNRSVIESAQVNGERGLWLTGPPHALTYVDRTGEVRTRTVLIHGNVLLWTRGELTLRLEGRLSKAQALRIARQTR
jgi:hypothetical protein